MDEPLELLYVMRMIADFDKKWDEQTPIIELAAKTKGKLFYSNYPLSANVDKDNFEISIINHFINRRIGFETVTAFKIALVNKLIEIMPKYNQMFDLMAKELELFNTNHTKDITETTDDDFTNNGTKNSVQNGTYSKVGSKVSDESGTHSDQSNTNETVNTIGEREEDLRKSDTPQNRLGDIKDGSYVSEYNYNQINTNEDTTKETDVVSSGNTYGEYNEDTTDDGTNKTLYDETTGETGERDISRIFRETYNTADNLVEKMQIFNEIPAIMTMIYNDLDCLFLQVYDY